MWRDWRRIILSSRIDGAEALGSIGRIGVGCARRDIANEIGLLVLVLVLALRLLVGGIVERRWKGSVLILA